VFNQGPVRIETDSPHKIDHVVTFHRTEELVIESHDERSCGRRHEDKPSQLGDEPCNGCPLVIVFRLPGLKQCTSGLPLDDPPSRINEGRAKPLPGERAACRRRSLVGEYRAHKLHDFLHIACAHLQFGP